MPKGNREKTKEKIVKVAISEFEKKGFIKASTLDIARKAETSHANIFFHFPQKADLIVEAIYYKLDPLLKHLDDVAYKYKDLKKLCELYLTEVEKNSAFYSRLVKELPLLPKGAKRTVFASLSEFSGHFVRVIEPLRKGNKNKIDVKVPLFYWFGMVSYIYSYMDLLGTEKLSKKDRDQLVDFFVNAIRKY